MELNFSDETEGHQSMVATIYRKDYMEERERVLDSQGVPFGEFEQWVMKNRLLAGAYGCDYVRQGFAILMEKGLVIEEKKVLRLHPGYVTYLRETYDWR